MPPPSRIWREPTPNIPRNRSQRRMLWPSIILIGVIVLGGVTWYFLRAPYFRLQEVVVEGTRQLDPATIQNVTASGLSGVQWLFVPKDNLFVVSPKALEERIRSEFSSLADVTVRRNFPDAIEVHVRERVLWGLYCEARVANETPHPCTYIDENGNMFEEFSNVEGALLPMIVGPESSSSDSGYIVSLMGFFRNAERELLGIEVAPVALRVSSSTPEDVSFELDEGWSIWVSKNQSAHDWYAILKTLLEKEIKGNRSRLEYVDLRFGQKVFYKLRQ